MEQILERLGYSTELENYRVTNDLGSFSVGRVISEHRERYIVQTEHDEYEAEVIGNLRFTARDRSDFPAVGDWVAVSAYDDDKVLIHAIFPRKTLLERTAVGKQGEKQIIASNVDYAFIIQAVDRDFNLNRIERYLTICSNAGVKPILVFTKTDLISDEELDQLLRAAETRSPELPVVAISNETKAGYDDLLQHITRGKTFCLLGSSGVGKSTLVNNISGRSAMKTDSISQSTRKGKHVTSHREMIVLENGGLMIDNPGMRELGIADAADGFEDVFSDVIRLSLNCRYNNCTHLHEKGCAVIQAVESGEMDKAHYGNYMKMMKEKLHFESSLAEKRKKDKDLGKIVKDYKKFKSRNE